MTIRDIIIKYSQELEKISDTPRLDVELFLQKALGGVDRIYIHLNLNKELTTEQYDEFIKYINDRVNGRPVAYIVGNREFMGLDFFVKEGVLIPRPDTETLVEEIIELCKNKSEQINILDTEKQFDVIVSNPPYIPKKDIETLHTQVKDYEPYNALEGGEDGLDFYRQITKESIDYLKQGGILAYEVGHDQAEDVSEIMKSYGYTKIYKKKDIQGIDRVVIGFKLWYNQRIDIDK